MSDAPANDGLIRYDHEGLPEVHFALPEKMNVRQQLEYFSTYYSDRQLPLYLRLWNSARTVITEWKCEVLPDVNTSLDEITDAKAATAIIWVGQEVLAYMGALERIPKA